MLKNIEINESLK